MKVLVPLACLLFASTAFAADRPSLVIAGDSTAADGTPTAVGWGRAFPHYFDASKINVVREARGGRSSRTFVTEGSVGPVAQSGAVRTRVSEGDVTARAVPCVTGVQGNVVSW